MYAYLYLFVNVRDMFLNEYPNNPCISKQTVCTTVSRTDGALFYMFLQHLPSFFCLPTGLSPRPPDRRSLFEAVPRNCTIWHNLFAVWAVGNVFAVTTPSLHPAGKLQHLSKGVLIPCMPCTPCIAIVVRAYGIVAIIVVCGMTIVPRTPTMPGRIMSGMSGCHRLGKHRVHQAKRSVVRWSAHRGKGKLHPSSTHL